MNGGVIGIPPHPLASLMAAPEPPRMLWCSSYWDGEESVKSSTRPVVLCWSELALQGTADASGGTDCHDRGEGCYWHVGSRGQGAVGHPVMHRTPQKDYLARYQQCQGWEPCSRWFPRCDSPGFIQTARPTLKASRIKRRSLRGYPGMEVLLGTSTAEDSTSLGVNSRCFLVHKTVLPSEWRFRWINQEPSRRTF